MSCEVRIPYFAATAPVIRSPMIASALTVVVWRAVAADAIRVLVSLRCKKCDAFDERPQVSGLVTSIEELTEGALMTCQ